ncbi:MAG: UTP--glucose-1-phosphate uridylyltransferase [Anaerolineae bacterium]
MSNFAPFAAKMRAEKLPDIAIRTFEHYYNQLVTGSTGLIPEESIEPVDSLPNADDFGNDLAEIGRAALPHTILLKLNGGLGTGMGLEKAKSLLTVKNGLTFLDIIARQVESSGMPLVLMNSFSTRDDSLAALQKYPHLSKNIPLDFLQHKVPKILQSDLSPAVWPDNPELEWCPPGHGDIYTALVTSGMLATLLQHGYKYVFVSNVDNLGAVVDPAILGYFAQNRLPFMMEVADRTEADRKGGHLARLPDGRFILRESAQCPPADEPAFQDIERHKYFNTNNLWIHLPTLQQVLTRKNGVLGLAMIRNSKTVDPRDKNSPAVYQLETAMGAAIAVFEGAGAVRVSRSRFAPIKKTSDLLNVRSDNYDLTDDFRVVAVHANPTVVELDPACYQLIDDLEARFPHGAPLLRQCRRLVVTGDFKFGSEVTLKGEVLLANLGSEQIVIEDGAEISGEWAAEG